MQCSWGKFQGAEHFVRDRGIFEIEGSRDRESPLYIRNTTLHLQVGMFKGDTKSYWKIIIVSATKIGENTTNILNCYFSS